MFERLYVAGHEPKRKEIGSGLGLAIARELTEAMGGTVRAEANPGGGARMVIALRRRPRHPCGPAAPVPAVDDAHAVRPTAAGAVPSPPAATPSVATRARSRARLDGAGPDRRAQPSRTPDQRQRAISAGHAPSSPRTVAAAGDLDPAGDERQGNGCAQPGERTALVTAPTTSSPTRPRPRPAGHLIALEHQAPQMAGHVAAPRSMRATSSWPV